MIAYEDRTALARAMPKRGVVAEIGVRQGEYAQVILNENDPQSLYLCDCWEYQPEGYDDEANVNQESQNEIYRLTRERFRHDKRVHFRRQFSHQAAGAMQDAGLTFDWVYLDANHAYENVLADLCLWWPLIWTGGFLCGHDYDNSPHPEVREAVDDFCRILRVPLYATTKEQTPTSFAIQKP